MSDFLDDGDNSDSDMENDTGLNDDMLDASEVGSIGWQEIALFGALSEQLADEERERLRIEREMNKEDEDQENFTP